MNSALERKLESLPRSPGVYFHKSKSGEIIYVGKAAVLRNRVRQYFQNSRSKDAKTLALINEIYDTDWVETETEVDALFLESEMVKRYMPRYNILLRDDKSQLFVRINMKDKWPHVEFTRNPLDDGAEYYGPYYNGYAVRKALRYLRRSFPYYLKSRRSGERASLYAHIGLEPDGMSSEEYKAELRKLISYLKGNRKKLMNEIERNMKREAKEQNFEKAAQLRNKLRNLDELRRRIMFGDREFLDISKDRALYQLQALIGLEESPARIEGFDISHLSGSSVVASQVVFINGVSYRSDYRKYKMSSEKNDDFANMYEVIFRRLSPRNLSSWGRPDVILIDGGKGQLEAAIKAMKDRNEYIPVFGVAKKEEVLILHKKYSCIKNTQIENLIKKPVSGVYIVNENNYYIIDLHSETRNSGGHSRNLRGGVFSEYSDLLKLVERIRDESHRFAVSYHTVLARKRQTKSQLEEIPGVGVQTRKKLLKKFGSVKGVARASEEEVAEIIGKSKALTVKNHLKQEEVT